MQRIGTMIILTLLSAACSAPNVEQDMPALLINPEPETLQEIERAVASATGGMNVTVAADALTQNSVLVIERGMQRGLDRPPELGRDPGRPYRFQLVINKSECMLLDQQTGEHWPLSDVECIEEEPGVDR